MSKLIISLYLFFALGFLLAGVWVIWFSREKRQFWGFKNRGVIKAQYILNFLSRYLHHFISWRYINFIEGKAAFLGLSFSALKLYFGQLGVVFIVVIFGLYQGYSLIVCLLMTVMSALLCFITPIVLFNNKAAKQKQGFLDAFSFFLDLLALNLGAGVSLRQGLKNAGSYSQSAFLHTNVQQLVHDLEQGIAVEEAWKKFAERCDQEEVDAFVFTILQAHRQGLALQQVLSQQARQIKVVVYTVAEKKALALPTKLIFPILIFIFPVTFIVIAFPLIYGAFMQSM